MQKREAMVAMSSKLPREVVDEFTRYSVQLGMTRNNLMVEALRAYLMMLRSGGRLLPERQLPQLDEGKGAT